MTTELLTSYINTPDLEECLDLFFKGEFDDCDQYLPRLYKDASEMKPGNSLFGQLDSSELEKAIWGLGSLHRASLEYHFTTSDKSWIVLKHYYFQESQQTSMDSWIGATYLEAIELLSYEVLGMI